MYSQIFSICLMICVANSYLTTEIRHSNGNRILAAWVPIPIIVDFAESEDGNHRIGGMDNEEEMCKSRKVMIAPFENVEKDQVWRYLFNDGMSSVEGEECVNPGRSCRLDLAGLSTKCVQKYTHRVILSTEGTEVDANFKIPSGCVCVY